MLKHAFIEHEKNGKWKMENGKWKMENGKWKMENGKWKMENGKWKMENGKWKMENGKYDIFYFQLSNVDLAFCRLNIICSLYMMPKLD